MSLFMRIGVENFESLLTKNHDKGLMIKNDDKESIEKADDHIENTILVPFKDRPRS